VEVSQLPTVLLLQKPGSGPLNPELPITRLTATVRNRNDVDQIGRCGVHHRERESPQDEMPEFPVDRRSEIRAFEQKLDDSLGFLAEASTQSGSCGIIVRDRLKQLQLGFRMKLVVHPPTRERRRANTSGLASYLACDELRVAPLSGFQPGAFHIGIGRGIKLGDERSKQINLILRAQLQDIAFDVSYRSCHDRAPLGSSRILKCTSRRQPAVNRRVRRCSMEIAGLALRDLNYRAQTGGPRASRRAQNF
jgi:hypothetical protein